MQVPPSSPTVTAAMLSDEMRARLEQLNRQRLPDVVAPRLAPLAVPRREEPIAPPVLGPRLAPLELTDDFSLAAVLPGTESLCERGTHYLVREPLERFWPEFSSHLARLEGRLSALEFLASLTAQRKLLAQTFPLKALFLDLETCGLAGSPIFLVGLIRATTDGLVLDQLLARNYVEELAILSTLETFVAECEVLVTFNGRSFDWPMVQDRRAYHRLPAIGAALPHVDLLIHARRHWRRQVPNCRLQTLERFLCRRMRQGDIPGSQIPAAYHQFVRTGDARQLRTILHHNALDLVTLAQLTMRMIVEDSDSAL